jgi:hypothetical protein
MTAVERATAFFLSLGLESAGPRVESLAREFESVSASDLRGASLFAMSLHKWSGHGDCHPDACEIGFLSTEAGKLRGENTRLQAELAAERVPMVADSSTFEGRKAALLERENTRLVEWNGLAQTLLTEALSWVEGYAYLQRTRGGKHGDRWYTKAAKADSCAASLRALLARTSDNAPLRQPADPSVGWRVAVCGNCGGDGLITGVTCSECRGRGRVAERVKP